MRGADRSTAATQDQGPEHLNPPPVAQTHILVQITKCMFDHPQHGFWHLLLLLS